MSTLAELRSQVSDEIQNDPGLRVSSGTLIDKNLNKSVVYIQQQNGYSLPENLDVDIISANAQEMNLNTDFIRVADPNGVKINTMTPLQPINYTQLLGMFDLSNTGQPVYYYIRKNGNNWVIGFYPSPNSTYTVTVPYNKSLPTMTALVDCPLTSDYDQALVEYALYLTLRRIRGYEKKALEYLQYFEDSSKKVKASRMNANSQAMSFNQQRYQDYYWGPKASFPPNALW